MQSECPHAKGFQHFDPELGGVERAFHLGYMFDQRDITEVREPEQLMYISYAPLPESQQLPPTLHFAVKAATIDAQEFVRRVRPVLTKILTDIQNGVPAPQTSRHTPLYI